MTQGTTFFRSKWYHIGMAAIYFIAGVLLIYKSFATNDHLQAGIIGWILCGYSIYRIVSRIQLLKKAKEEE